jgi:hypothetical protein
VNEEKEGSRRQRIKPNQTTTITKKNNNFIIIIITQRGTNTRTPTARRPFLAIGGRELLEECVVDGDDRFHLVGDTAGGGPLGVDLAHALLGDGGETEFLPLAQLHQENPWIRRTIRGGGRWRSWQNRCVRHRLWVQRRRWCLAERTYFRVGGAQVM